MRSLLARHHPRVRVAEQPQPEDDDASKPQPAARPLEDAKRDVGITKTKKLSVILSAARRLNVFKSKSVSQSKPVVKCMVSSLYGYASLKLFEAKPRACMNKVLRGRSGLNDHFLFARPQHHANRIHPSHHTQLYIRWFAYHGSQRFCRF